MKPLHVAVLMGGPSAEREVSLQSGRVVAEALRSAGARVTEVDVRGPDFELPADTDVAFVALHGTFGEDGSIQRILEERGVPYTGSDSEASERAFDKVAAKTAFVKAGIPTPTYHVVEDNLAVLRGLQLPVVVKPASQGSSMGITIVRQASGLAAACAEARRFDKRLIIEQWICGREFTVGILGKKALPVIEVRTDHEFFDFDAKYTPGEAEEIVPAPLDSLVAARIQLMAQRAHECLGCRDFSRVDVMMGGDEELFVLEVNTIPGLTRNSLLPKAARATGMGVRELCARMVEMALATTAAR